MLHVRETSFWHPFADMGAVRSSSLEIVRGEDVWVWSADGTRYLDATASLWYCNAGHGRAEIADAVAAQMRSLEAYSAFGDLTNGPAEALSRRLADHAPMEDAKVFLASGGGDAIETAAKLARRFFVETGQPSRDHLVVRSNGYHGTHGFGTSLAGIEANRSSWGPLVPDISIVGKDDLLELRGVLERESVAAVFVEPVIGAGGLYPPTAGYIEGAAELCREYGALFVCDSVICAFGRLGTWFGIERFDVEPDMITFAKGVTSGYLPLGGLVVAGRVAEPFFAAPGGPMFRHGATYAGHATVCAAAMANLDLLEDGLMTRGQELELSLYAALQALESHDKVAEIRGGTGTLAAVALDPELGPAAPGRLALATRANGVLVRALATGVATSPPLTATPEHFGLIADAIGAALDEV
ncbi:MAG: hypothetical protein QOF76_2165 [Solirubrobacteraceae bacterium]|jgi:adenosylmethionine-8-amino-7-oxononanoate aminotransferase|nr:hypothetical protein [Solirubrobacteraceae bacterium]